MTEPSAPSSSSSSSASASASNPPMQPLPEFNRANGFEVTELTEDKKVKKITKFDPNATGAKPSFTIPNNFTVYFHVTAFFKKTQQIFMNQKEDFVEVVLGQTKLPRGLEIGLKTMQPNERALIECSIDYAFQDGDCPPGVDLSKLDKSDSVMFDIMVSGIEPPYNLKEMSINDRFALASRKKEVGNELFKANLFKSAFSNYQKALAVVATFANDDPKKEGYDLAKFKELQLAILLNLSNSSLKLGIWDALQQFTQLILQIDPKNVKGQYRFALGIKNLKKDYSAAIEILRNIEEYALPPEKGPIQKEIKELQALIKDDILKETKMQGFLNKSDKGTGGLYDDVDDKGAKERVAQREENIEKPAPLSPSRPVQETDEMKQKEKELLTQLYSEFEKEQRKESACSKICEQFSSLFSSFFSGKKKEYVPLNKKDD